MKTIRTLSLTAMLVTSLAALATAAEPPIAWSDNLYESFLSTTSSGKLLIVYYTSPNNTFCRQLERGVFNEPEMAPFAHKAEFVRADSDDEDDKGNYGQLKRDLKIDKYPTVVVLQSSPEGIRERGRIVGYFPLEEFVSNLNQILEPVSAPVAIAEPTL